MNSETKTCQNCKNQFTVEPDDFAFYEKIKVPPPTWCPECRMQRRLIFRNERNFYKGICRQCDKSIVSIHNPESEYRIFCQDCWKSDCWDPLAYGRDYDWSKPFFVQFKELREAVPRPNLYQVDSLNSPYAHMTIRGRHLYMSFSVLESEDVFFSRNIDFSSDIFDCINLINSQNCYENAFGDRNFNCSYTVSSQDCMNSAFLYYCRNCQNCVLSHNLRNAQYVIRNRQYTKEEYLKQLEGLGLDSFKSVQNLKKEFENMVAVSLHKYADVMRTVNSSGNYLLDTKNAKNVFEAFKVENGKYALRLVKCKDGMDACNSANSELVYEFISGSYHYDLKFGLNCPDNVQSSEYVDYCRDISDCFGCAGLRNKQYCILNKQYDEPEYKDMVQKIKRHMDDMPYTDTRGRVYKYGEFLPVDMTPFDYVESVANDYFQMERRNALGHGYKWNERKKRELKVDFAPDNLPDRIDEVNESILQKNIKCEHGGECTDLCSFAFRVIPDELVFYKKNKIPLPHLCPNCRYFLRKKRRLPLHLWQRACTCVGEESKNSVWRNIATHFHGKEPCPNTFETSYAPDRPEIVYCEQCYNAEVA